MEDRIVDSTGVIIVMKIAVEKKVVVGLGKGHFQEVTIIIEEMIEAKAIDQGLDQE